MGRDVSTDSLVVVLVASGCRPAVTRQFRAFTLTPDRGGMTHRQCRTMLLRMRQRTACWRLTCLFTRGDDMPVFDAQRAADGPGRFFANHPAVYWLSLAGSSSASAYALMRVGNQRGDRRPLWAAMAVLEAGTTAGIIQARNSAVMGRSEPRPQAPNPGNEREHFGL